MRAALRELGAITAAGVVISGLATWYELSVYLPSLNSPHTFLEDVAHRPSDVAPGPGLARRVAVIMVDGLSYDAARTLDELLPLRRGGVLRSIAVELPSFTSPGEVSMMTGLTPRDSGTRRNGDLQGTVGLDTLMMALGDAHVPVRVFGRGAADQVKILEPPAGAAFYAGKLAPAVDLGRRGLAGAEPPGVDGKSPSRTFDWTHWAEVDEAGHRHGNASPEYREQSVNAARFVVHYASTLDLDQDSLVVLSDHGHTRRGGHGGDEPEVMHSLFLGVGSIFRQGVELGERPMRDIASTLAVLAGVRVPSSNLGLPMLDAFSLGDRETAYLLAGPFDESMRYLCTLHYSPRCAEVPALVESLHEPDIAAFDKAVELHDTLYAEREADLTGRRAHAGARKLAISAVGLAGLGLIVQGALRRARVRLAATAPALLTPFLLAGTYVAIMAYRGYRPSFTNLMPIPIFARDATPASAVAVAVVALFVWLTRAGRHAGWVLLAGIAVPFALLVAWVGWDTRTVPPNVAGVLVFLLGPLILAASVGAVVLSVLPARVPSKQTG